MKRFEKPIMIIQRLERDEILRTSGCMVEAVACISCYASAVECPSGFTCSSLVCPTLNDID